MNISSLNPGSKKEEQMHRYIIKNLARNKIHISAIQETHIIQDRDYARDNYRCIAAAATKRIETGVAQGGKAVMIPESTRQYITQIARQSSRALRVTQGRKNSTMAIQILTA